MAGLLLAPGCSDDGVAQDQNTGASPGTAGAGTTTNAGADDGAAGDDNGGADQGEHGDAGGDDGGEAGGTSGGQGTSDGASGSGGTSGSTGASGTGTEGTGTSGDTGGETPVCQTPADCTKVDDCCTCSAIHVDESAPECEMNCFAPQCSGLGLTEVSPTCRLGVCELERVNCQADQVDCAQVPPQCSAGDLPRVVDGCWDGCVPAAYCDYVPDCSYCDTATQVCVEHVAFTSMFTCEPKPASCGDTPDCACMSDACGESDVCTDQGGQIACECTVCAGGSSQP